MACIFTSPSISCISAYILLQITKDARMSFGDKVSWIGGMLGLFTGFSLISGFEIIYWLWFKVILHDKDGAAVEPVNTINVKVFIYR